MEHPLLLIQIELPREYCEGQTGLAVLDRSKSLGQVYRDLRAGGSEPRKGGRLDSSRADEQAVVYGTVHRKYGTLPGTISKRCSIAWGQADSHLPDVIWCYR
jgi:hypothetical protein